MNLRKMLSEEAVSLDLKGSTKTEILNELMDLLVASGQVRDRKSAMKAIEEREAKMSTGMQNGLALPHAKCDSVDRLVVAIGIKREGVDFDSVDKAPSHIFVMTLSPLNRTGPHIQFLAEIGRLISQPEVRQRVLTATTAAGVIAALSTE